MDINLEFKSYLHLKDNNTLDDVADAINDIVKYVAKRLGISPEEMTTVSKIYHGLDLDRDKITLGNMGRFLECSRSYLEMNPSTAYDWDGLCKNYLLGESFIDNFSSKVSWKWIVHYMNKGYYTFSKKFLAKYRREIEDITSYIHKHPSCLSPKEVDFKGAKERINKEEYDKNKKDFLRNQSEGNINLPPDMPMIPMNGIPIIGIDFGGGTPQFIQQPPYGNIDEEVADVKNTIITPDNFEELFNTPIYRMSRGMIDDLILNYKLSPEFVYKYEEIINFKKLMTNPYFPTLMKNDKFFDKYIKLCQNITNIKHPVHGKERGFILRKDKLRE